MSFIFFVDRSLGKKAVADALRNAGEQVEVHDDLFPQNAEDTAWLPIVAQKGWIIVTNDSKIGNRQLELLAVRNSKAKVFVLVSGQIKGEDMAKIFVEALEPMKKLVAQQPGPFIAKVYKNGTVRIWKT